MAKPQIFVYECITGGGWRDQADLPASLRQEGEAMVRAICADLAGCGASVEILRDSRLTQLMIPDCTWTDVRTSDDERRLLSEIAARSDWTLVIAPEFDGHLESRVRQIESAGGRLLSPGSTFVTLTADKWRTNQRLATAGVAVPPARWLPGTTPLPADFSYPAVAKRRDGAGSVGVQLVPSATTVLDRADLAAGVLLEKFCAGVAASIAVIRGPQITICLPAGMQRLSNDGRFRYLGGCLPWQGELADRAAALARQTVACLPATIGYIGMDVILGSCPSEDVVIEVNPRLTTSYVGLRKLAVTNLAAVMLAAGEGRAVPVEWRPHISIAFDATGQAREVPPS